MKIIDLGAKSASVGRGESGNFQNALTIFIGHEDKSMHLFSLGISASKGDKRVKEKSRPFRERNIHVRHQACMAGGGGREITWGEAKDAGTASRRALSSGVLCNEWATVSYLAEQLYSPVL